MVINGRLYLDRITPAADSEAVKLIAAHLNSQNKPELVKRTNKPKPLGNCYWNVAQVLSESGGEIALGWAISLAPNLYVEALHHGVWRMPNGRLIDVTEPVNEIQRSNYTLFIPDERKSVSLDRPAYIDNEYVCLTDNEAVTKDIELYRSLQILRRQQADIAWEAGSRGESFFIRARGGDPNSAAIEVAGDLATRWHDISRSVAAIERQREQLRIVLCGIQDRARSANKD